MREIGEIARRCTGVEAIDEPTPGRVAGLADGQIEDARHRTVAGGAAVGQHDEPVPIRVVNYPRIEDEAGAVPEEGGEMFRCEGVRVPIEHHDNVVVALHHPARAGRDVAVGRNEIAAGGLRFIRAAGLGNERHVGARGWSRGAGFCLSVGARRRGVLGCGVIGHRDRRPVDRQARRPRRRRHLGGAVQIDRLARTGAALHSRILCVRGWCDCRGQRQ